MAKITVQRLSAFHLTKSPGWGNSVTLDGQKTGIMWGNKKEMEVVPGMHTIFVKNMAGNSNIYEFEIKDGEEKVFEIQIRRAVTMVPMVLLLLVPVVVEVLVLHYYSKELKAVAPILIAFVICWGLAFTCFRKDFLVIDEKK
jgi:hypothetical protein